MTVYTRSESQAPSPDRGAVLSMALAAAADGQAVFPLKGKVPAISRREGGQGYKDASREASRVTALFNRVGRKATGYGIATGRRSGIVVVDIDGPEGVEAARRMGLSSDHVVRTGRELEGWHLYFRAPHGHEIPSFDLADNVEVKAEGSYVVGPGSLHPSGRSYRVVRDGAPDALPEFVLEAALATAARERKASSTSLPPVSIDVAGPEIPDGGRNRTLARICGRLHDGSRNLGQLIADLTAINQARCTPPLGGDEVQRIAESIFSRPPCTPGEGRGRSATPQVRAAVRYLREAAEERPVRGVAGASGWRIYHAGLEACTKFGREHPEGVALSLDSRSWAQLAATEASTVSRWIRRTPLVRVLERGSGRRATTVVFIVPDKGRSQIGDYLQHSTTKGDIEENEVGSVATDPLFRTLYRSRWSKRAYKPKRGVARGTRMVRQGPQPDARDGIKRMGPSQAALLWKVLKHPDASRAELAAMLGVKPDSLKKRLRSLVDAGMIVRTSRGHYAPAPDLERRLQDARGLGKEPEDDRLQIARHERQRDGYRRRHESPADRAPSEEEMREHRESYPERRRFAIEQAIARLFAERPEYRSRRVGQITARLVHYIGEDFPRGKLGVPKDPEVEVILDGELRTG